MILWANYKTGFSVYLALFLNTFKLWFYFLVSLTQILKRRESLPYSPLANLSTSAKHCHYQHIIITLWGSKKMILLPYCHVPYARLGNWCMGQNSFSTFPLVECPCTMFSMQSSVGLPNLTDPRENITDLVSLLLFDLNESVHEYFPRI